MTPFDWVRMVLADFLVPIAWPVVALCAVFVLKRQLQAVIQQLADSIGKLLAERAIKTEVGPFKFEVLPVPQVDVKKIPPAEPE